MLKIEFEQLIKSSTLDLKSRLRTALQQEKISHLKGDEVFSKLEMIQKFTRLKNNLEQWIKKGGSSGETTK